MLELHKKLAHKLAMFFFIAEVFLLILLISSAELIILLPLVTVHICLTTSILMYRMSQIGYIYIPNDKLMKTYFRALFFLKPKF